MRADARRSVFGSPVARTLFVALALTVHATPAMADRFAICGPGFAIPERPPFEGDPSKETIEITADEAELSDEGISLLRGNVQYGSGERRLLAESLTYDKPKGYVVASGSLKLWDNGLFVEGKRVEIDLGKDQVELQDPSFILQERHGRGGAQRMVISGRDLVQVEDAQYTTCNVGEEDWMLNAKHIALDKLEDVGTARDVTVEFMGQPIFYAPFLTFPLSNARKSGFLTPSFTIDDETGVEATIPYYFNIAPQLDATVWARPMTKRGGLVGGEVRYLTEFGGGDFSAEIVPHDTEDDETRGQVVFRHEGSFAPGWATNLEFSRVSDKEYFEDFGNTLNMTSTRHLQQLADVTYSRGNLSALARVQSFQTVDRTIAAQDRPYKRLPQVVVNYQTPERNRQLRYGVRAEGVSFDRRSSVTGVRADVEPFVSYPMRTASTFLIPTAKLRYTQYALDNTAAGIDDSPSRLIPTLSVDSGVFLERGTSMFGRNYVHTLEPRLYYLFQGFDDQRNIPVFDTGRNTFSFAQLFRDDRFNGADRVGDAHQFSVALTTRLLESGSGDELLRASIGQIHHFRDRRVQLPGAAVETTNSSDLVGELSARVTDAWSFTGGMHWSPDDNQTNRSIASLRYQPDDERVVNLAYRFVRDAVETSDVSFRWPLRHDIGLVGRWNYALADERTIDAFAGLEYNSCCWAMRAIARRFLSDISGDYSTSFFVQLELKGLAGLGRNAEKLLQRSIPGYKNPF